MKRKFLLILLAFASMILVSCDMVNNSDGGKLKVAVEGAYPPFSSVDAKGKVSGFDIDIANAICAEMKVECELVLQDWDGMIPGLIARKYDMIIASMSITEERKQKVDFSDKYYSSGAQFIVSKGTTYDVAPGKQLQAKIGVQRGSVSANFVLDNYPSATILQYTSQDDANLDITNGKVDLVFYDNIAAFTGFLKSDSGEAFEFIGPVYSDKKWFGDGIGIPVRKGEDKLQAKINTAISAIRSNGTYDKIRKAYFHFDIY